jgi:hypothetical protein
MIDGKPVIGEPGLRTAFDATNVTIADAAVDDSPRIIARWIADHVSRMQLKESGFEVLN